MFRSVLTHCALAACALALMPTTAALGADHHGAAPGTAMHEPGHHRDKHRHPSGLTSLESAYSVAITLDRLEQIVTSHGAQVFARIDHAAGAQSIGESLEPTEVLIFGNPAMGTPLIDTARTIALDLPVRVLAWRTGDQVQLAYTDPQALAARHGLEPDAMEAMSNALSRFTAQAASDDPLP